MRHEEDVVADARLAGALAVAYEANGVGIARNARTWDRGLLHNDTALAYIARLVPRLTWHTQAGGARLEADIMRYDLKGQ